MAFDDSPARSWFSNAPRQLSVLSCPHVRWKRVISLHVDGLCLSTDGQHISALSNECRIAGAVNCRGNKGAACNKSAKRVRRKDSNYFLEVFHNSSSSSQRKSSATETLISMKTIRELCMESNVLLLAWKTACIAYSHHETLATSHELFNVDSVRYLYKPE